MDNITHTITGLMLSRAGLNRFCPRATALLLLASNLPDIDIVTASQGSLTYLDHHRGITHALVSAPLLGLALAALVRFAGRKPFPLWKGTLTAIIGILGHLLMDYTNTYGIRMLLPFSPDWLRLDITNVVDLWIWAALFLGIAAPLLSRLVSSEIGAKPGTGRGPAIAVLVFLVLYTGGRWVLHERAVNELSSFLYDGAAPRRVAAFPHLANPLQWTGLVETSRSVSISTINLLMPYDPTGGDVYYFPERSAAIDAARRTQTFRRYLRFAQFPFWRVTPVSEPEGGLKVEAMDLRFGRPDAPRFVATAILDAANRVVEEQYGFGPARPR